MTACLSAAQAGRSPSRVRQLRWVVSELTVHAATLPQGRPTTTADWFDPEFVTGYLRAADGGELRSRASARRPSPDATRRIRRACLRLLAQAAGLEDPVPASVGVALPPLRPRVDDQAANGALRHWRSRASTRNARPADVRTAAMAVLVREADMRSGELAALKPEDLDLAEGTVTYQPRPPSTRSLPPERTVRLSGPAVATLKQWLAVRTEPTHKTPRTRSLWVSLAANHDGHGVRRPAGMPLQPTGLRRAHARAVAALNADLVGASGFEPLPRTVGQLRHE